MQAIPLAMSAETMQQAHEIAGMIYLFLPLFLALVAGICLVVTTFRNTLDAGKAASLSALGAVVVIGLVAIEGRKHGPQGPPPPPHGASAGVAATPSIERAPGAALENERQLERLTEENARLRSKLEKIAEKIQQFDAPSPASAAHTIVAPRLPGGKLGNGGTLPQAAAPALPTNPPAPKVVEEPSAPAPAPAPAKIEGGPKPLPTEPAKEVPPAPPAPAKDAPAPPAEGAPGGVDGAKSDEKP